MNGLVAATANHSGLLDAYGLLRQRLTKSQVAILMYHRVAPKEDNWSIDPLSVESVAVNKYRTPDKH